jgi:hypothetical protein
MIRVDRMSWQLMRIGWPNTGIIFALALLPLAAVVSDRAGPYEARAPLAGICENLSADQPVNCATFVAQR